MAENDIAIQVGVVLDTDDIGKQLANIKTDKNNSIKLSANLEDVKTAVKEYKESLGKDSNAAKLLIDVLKGKSDDNVKRYVDSIHEKYLKSPIKITLDVDTQATTANINKAVGEMQQQVQKAVDQAVKSAGSAAGSSTTATANSSLSLPNASGDTKYWNELNDAIQRYSSAFDDVEAKVTKWRISEDMEGNARAAVEFKNSIGEITTAMFRLQDVLDAENNPTGDKEWVAIGDSYVKSFQVAEQAARKMYEELNKGYRESEKQAEQQYQMYDKMFAKVEQGAQKTSDYLSKQEAEFSKLYSGAFEQKNPLTGEFADKALDALQKYQDEYQNVAKTGITATDAQIRKINELRDAAALAIREQQSLQQQFNSDKRQDYSGLFGQSKEWEAALKQITDAENKLNEIQKNAFSGTNALTGDFAKEAIRQIDEVKNIFAEIRKTAEESFGGAATVSKDALKKMVDDLKSDLDRLAKLEYPSDKLAAQNVDVKKAFAADALVEMEERLKSLGDSTTEYYNKVQDLKMILSTVGQVDSDPSAWAKFRNEFHMLEDEIKKFEASAQGMGQKLATGLKNNQLQQITEMVDRLNNIDEKFNGAGVERLQQSLQSLAQEYMNVIEQLQNPSLSKDEYDALASKVKELSDQFKQAQNAVRIFNDGFKNEGDLRKYEQSADALRMRFEQLQNTYANLANRNPEIAERFREVENAINGMDPKNIAEVSRQVGNLAKECGNASGQSAGLRGALTDAFGGLGSYLARFTSAYFLINKTIQGLKSLVNQVKEVDTSLVELRKVTSLSGDALEKFTDQAYELGKGLGRTGKDVIDAVTTFSRAGYDLQQATELAQSALVMTNVGVDIPNIESAASDMISILKAFDIQAEESMSVIDKLYNVANKEPLDFGNLTQMLVTAGGTLAQSGSSLEETMGLLTGAFATMRTSSVANGLLMISQRLRGLSEDGEAIDGLVPKLQNLFSSVGINIEDQNGELRSTFDILQDLAGVWDQLSSKQKQYFGEKVAGNRQVKTLNAIMQNWEVVADTIEKANNAQGAAIEGNEMYMDSIEGRITQLKSAIQELAKATIDSSFMKGLVSAGTAVVKLATNLGGLGPILTTILGLITAIKGTKIAEGLGKIGTALLDLIKGAGTGLSLATGWVGILITLVGLIVSVTTAINNAKSSLENFKKAKDAYEEQKNKVEELNSELETTESRIRELENKDSLTVVEQEELDRLKDVNEELRIQKQLEEDILAVRNREKVEAAAKVLNEEFRSKRHGGLFGGVNTYSETTRNVLKDRDYFDFTPTDNTWGPATYDALTPTVKEQAEAAVTALEVELQEIDRIKKEIRDASDDVTRNALKGELDTWEEYRDKTEQEMVGYRDKLSSTLADVNRTEDAEPGSAQEAVNAWYALYDSIGEAISKAERTRKSIKEQVDEDINDVLSQYPDDVKQIEEQMNELGDDWTLTGLDKATDQMVIAHDKLLNEVNGIVDALESINDYEVHQTLGDILIEQFGGGNIDVLNRTIVHGADMLERGWNEFKGIEDSIATYFSSQYSDEIAGIPFTFSITPIDADGNILSPAELNEYINSLFDGVKSIDEFIARDSIQNGGSGLIIHYTPAIDMSPEAAEEAEIAVGQLLHIIDGAFEQARLDTAGDENASVADYLRALIDNALDDPSFTGQALTEVYTVLNELAKRMAGDGNTALSEAMEGLDVPAAIEQGMGIAELTPEDIGSAHFSDVINALIASFGWDLNRVDQFFRQRNTKPELDLGPTMSVDVNDTVSKLFQSTDGYSKVLSKALTEQQKAGELTAETVQKLLSDDGLPGIEECLERTANGYALNTQRVNEYVNAQNKDVRLNAIAGIMEREIAIAELTASLGTLTDAQEIASKEAQIANYENEILQLQIIADEAYNAADALDALREANKTPNQDSEHTEAQTLLKGTEEMFEVGKYGTDDFKSGMDFLLGEGWYERFDKDIDKAFAAWKKKRDLYFAEDDADSANNFLKFLDENKIAEVDKLTGKVTLLKNANTDAAWTFEEIADKMGVSEEAVRTLFGLLNSYSYEDQFEFTESIESAEQLAVAEQRLLEIQQARQKALEELEEAEKGGDTKVIEEKQEEVDKLTEKEKNLTEAIQTANDLLGEDTKPLTLEEALKKIEELQQAIDTFNKDYKITPTVEMTDEYERLVKLVFGGEENGNGGITLTVNNLDDAKNKLEAAQKALEYLNNNDNVNPEVKLQLQQDGDITIDALEGIVRVYEALPARQEKAMVVTVDANGNVAVEELDKVDTKYKEVKESTESNPVKIKAEDKTGETTDAIKEEFNNMEEEGVDVPVKAESDNDSIKEAQEEISKSFSTPEQADVNIKVKGEKTAADKIDKVAVDRTAKIKVEVVNEGEPVKPSDLTEDQWKEYQDRVGDQYAIPMVLSNDPIVTPKINKTKFGEEFKSALKSAEEGSDPVNIGVSAEVDTESFDNAHEELSNLPSPEELESTYKVKAEADTSGIEEDVEEAVEEIPDQEVPVDAGVEDIPGQIEDAVASANPGDVNVSQNITQTVTTDNSGVKKSETGTITFKGDATEAEQVVDSVKNDAEQGATMPLDADPTKADQQNEDLKKRIEVGATKPVWLFLNNALQSLLNFEKRIVQAVYKTVYVTYKETNQNPTQKNASGTKRAKEGLSLVDEKGAELIEHRKQNTFELGTDEGARLTHLDEGDVVHTASETKKILSRIGDVGSFIRNGLSAARALFGNAFAGGTSVGGSAVVRPKKKKTEEKKTSTRGTSSSRSSTSSTTDAEDDALSAWNDWAKQFFDWIEIKLNNLNKATGAFVEKIQDAIGIAGKSKAIQDALSAVRDEIDANTEAMARYQEQANQVAFEGGLSNDIIQRIQNGTIDISQYDDLTQQKIQEYQKWYEKAVQCADALDELRKKEIELARMGLQNIVDEYEAYQKLLRGDIGIGAAKRGAKEAQGKEVFGAAYKEGYGFSGYYGDYNDEIEASIQSLNQLQQAKDDLEAELQQKMQEGTVKYGDSAWLEYQSQLKTYEEEIYKTIEATEKLKDEARNTTLDKYGYRVEDAKYDVQQRESNIDLGTKSGTMSRTAAKSEYKTIIKDYKAVNDLLAKQNEGYKQLQVGLDENSKEYQELERKIRANESAMNQNNEAIAEYEDKIRQMPLEKLGYSLNVLTDKADKLSDTISMKVLQGVELTAGAYKQLIANAKDQIANLKDQVAYYEQLLGTMDKNSDEYYRTKELIRGLTASIRDLDASIVQWGKDMKNLALEKLGWELDALKAKADALNDSMSLKGVQGVAVTVGDYIDLIQNAEAQIDTLNSKNEDLRKQQQTGGENGGPMDVQSEAYQALEKEINANNSAIRQYEISIVRWGNAIKEMPISVAEHKIDNLNDAIEENNDLIKYREAIGKEITEDYYKILMQGANAEIQVLEEQARVYEQLMTHLVQEHGEMAYESDLYKQYEKSLSGIKGKIRDLTFSIAEWADEINNLPLEKLSWDLDAVNAAAERLNGLKSLNEAQGIKITEDAYKNLIASGMERIKILEAQNKLLVSQQKGLDKNSKKFQDLQKKIVANDKEILSIKTAQEQWNDAITDLKIDDLKEYKDEMTKINEEVQQQRDYNKALQEFEKAESQRKVRTYVEGQGFVYQRDEEAFKEAQENLEDVIKNQLMSKIDKMIELLDDSKADDNIYDRFGNYITDGSNVLSNAIAEGTDEDSPIAEDVNQNSDAITSAISEAANLITDTIVEEEYPDYSEDFNKVLSGIDDLKSEVSKIIDRETENPTTVDIPIENRETENPTTVDIPIEIGKDLTITDSNGNVIGTPYYSPLVDTQLTTLSPSIPSAKFGSDGREVRNEVKSNSMPSMSVTIGDIVLSEVNDSSALANEIVNQLPNALLQELYRK